MLRNLKLLIPFFAFAIFACESTKTTTTQTETTVTEEEWDIEQEVENESIGQAQLTVGDTDRSENGIFGRKLTSDYKAGVKALKANVDPKYKGEKVQIITCIDQRGIVMMARMDEKVTTVKDMDLQRLVGKLVVEQTFEPKSSAPDRECGILSVSF